MSKLNLIGQKFGKLMVLKEAPSIDGDTAWLCQCECGNSKITKTEYLRNGDCKSCGCIVKEKCIMMGKLNAKKRRNLDYAMAYLVKEDQSIEALKENEKDRIIRRGTLPKEKSTRGRPRNQLY